MLLTDDKSKQILEDNKLPYQEFNTISEIYLIELLTDSIASGIELEEIDNIPENIDKTFYYLMNNEEISKKIRSKYKKFENEVFNTIHDMIETNKDVILSQKLDDINE